MRISGLIIIALLFSLPAWAQLEDTSVDAPGTSMNPVVNQKAMGETESSNGAPTERDAIERAKKSKAKVVYEGFQNPTDAPVKPASLQDSLVIKTELDYASKGKKLRAERIVFLTEENKDWLNLTRPRDGVVVLGRLIERGQTKIKLEYIVLDTSREDDQVISPPSVEAVVGQKTVINLDGANEKITVSLTTQWRKL